MELLYYHTFCTAAGWIAVLATGTGLLRSSLFYNSEQKAIDSLDITPESATFAPGRFERLEKRFKDYFNSHNVSFSDELDLSEATYFQRDVWQTARLIPYGETRSYSWVANKINRPRASRAVGLALGKNPLPIIVPCHRVIGGNGNPTGYSGGLEVKRKLLSIEGVSDLY